MSDAFEPPKSRGRGKLWLLIGGLLVVLFCCLPVGACGTFGTGIYATVSAAIRSSDAFVLPLQAAQADATVQAALGTPVEDGWFVMGSIETSGSSGSADLTIPVSGPDGSGTLYVRAHKSAGRWAFDVAEVALEDGRRVDLRPVLP